MFILQDTQKNTTPKSFHREIKLHLAALYLKMDLFP